MMIEPRLIYAKLIKANFKPGERKDIALEADVYLDWVASLPVAVK